MEKHEQTYEVREARTYVLPGEAAAAVKAPADRQRPEKDQDGRKEDE